MKCFCVSVPFVMLVLLYILFACLAVVTTSRDSHFSVVAFFKFDCANDENDRGNVDSRMGKIMYQDELSMCSV